jgi:hypothetical protein
MNEETASYVALECPFCGQRAGIAGPYSVQCESCSGNGPSGHDPAHGEALWGMRANAKLIDSSPILLAALEEIANLRFGWEGDCGAVMIAEAAIEAATDAT